MYVMGTLRLALLDENLIGSTCTSRTVFANKGCIKPMRSLLLDANLF